jgi:MFS family permease
VWSLIGFAVFFAMGVGPIPYAYVGEILPDEVKAPISALGLGSNWLANSMIALGFPIAVQGIGLAATFAVLAVINAAASVFGAVLMVETRQKSLPEIHDLLLGKTAHAHA